MLVLARAKDPSTGRSVLAGARTTCLPKYMERGAYLMTFWKLGRYYRTYPAYVEDEVRAALDAPRRSSSAARWWSRSAAPTPTTSGAFVVEDGRYVSARWPGDAYLFAKRFDRMLSA